MDAACSRSFRANRDYKCVSFAALTGAAAKDDQETLHDLSLSRCLARKFDLVARQRHGAKSAIVEEAIRVQLEQPQHPGIEEGMADGSTT
jgi:hypothetical protein